MKKQITLFLAITMMLSLCACGAKSIGSGESEEKLLEQYALAETAIPALPEAPDYAELNVKLNELDYDKLGAEAYQDAQDEIYDEFWEKQNTYREAINTLRGSGVGESHLSALTQYSVQTIAPLLSSEENVIYSPANLYLALAMLAETTDGKTRAEVLNLLGQPDITSARACANSIWRNLYTVSDSGTTQLANSIWTADRIDTYHDETLQRLSEDYYASAFSVPMGNQEADEAIAAWINQNTGNLLEDAASELKTQQNTVMMLLSTLYFYDQWSDSFNEASTCEDTFTALGGDEQAVPFMHMTQDSAGYVRGDGWTMAELWFRNGERMVFLLPDEGILPGTLLQNPEVVNAFLHGTSDNDNIQYAKLFWSVPKFDISSNLELSDALKALGITSVFKPNLADFSPLADFENPVSVSKVQHAARVKVDEDGCEAAAFTAIVATEATMLEEPQELDFNLNRPFAFMITGVDGLPLFVGTVNTMQ